MKKLTFAVLFLLLGASAPEGRCSSTTGTASAQFLKLPVDAYRSAMGDVAAACARGPAALFQNPAGLVENRYRAASFAHGLLYEGLASDTLAFAQPTPKRGVFGLGVQSLRYGSFASRDNTGAPAGSLSPSDAAVTLGWGKSLDTDITVGAAVKYISSKISGSAAASALDLGLLITGDDLNFGFAVQNMGKGLKFGSDYSALPTNVRLGVAIPYSYQWEWVADVNFPKDGAPWLAAGGEYAFEVKGEWMLFGRLGFNTAASDTGGVNGLSAGFGGQKKNLTVDYAFRTMGVLGATHHLGLGYRWGK